MPESTINALITAIGSMVGGIIGAYATIQAAKVKLPNNSFNSKRTKFPFSGIIIGTVIGATATLVILVLLGFVSIPTPAPKGDVQETNVLFNQSFDNGNADGITYLGDRTVWSIIKDETGNYVLDGDNTNGKDEYPRAVWGDESWEDYELSLRIRFINQSPQWTGGIIYFRSNATHRSYQLNLNPFDDDVTINFDGASYSTLDRTSFIVDPQKWYLVYIKADGENMLIKIDDNWVFELSDTNRSNGNLNLVPEQGVHLQVDDIAVELLPED